MSRAVWTFLGHPGVTASVSLAASLWGFLVGMEVRSRRGRGAHRCVAWGSGHSGSVPFLVAGGGAANRVILRLTGQPLGRASTLSDRGVCAKPWPQCRPRGGSASHTGSEPS